jgi:hypothetical protein
MRARLSLLAFAAALVVPSVAHAYERQQHLGFDALGAYMTTDGTGKLGIDLGLHYTYGLSDALNLVADAGGSTFTSSGATGPQPAGIVYGGVGVVYVFDVLRWVPYAGGLIGPAYFTGGTVPSPFVTPDLQIAAGLDYAIDRSWSVGLAYRQHMFLAKTGDYPEYTSVGLRAEYTWGW